MPHLKALELASAAPPRASADAVQRAREKAVEFKHQLENEIVRRAITDRKRMRKTI